MGAGCDAWGAPVGLGLLAIRYDPAHLGRSSDVPATYGRAQADIPKRGWIFNADQGARKAAQGLGVTA